MSSETSKSYSKMYFISNNMDEDMKTINNDFKNIIKSNENTQGICKLSKFEMNDKSTKKVFINFEFLIDLTKTQFDKFAEKVCKSLDKQVKIFYKSIDGTTKYIYNDFKNDNEINLDDVKKSLDNFLN